MDDVKSLLAARPLVSLPHGRVVSFFLASSQYVCLSFAALLRLSCRVSRRCLAYRNQHDDARHVQQRPQHATAPCATHAPCAALPLFRLGQPL